MTGGSERGLPALKALFLFRPTRDFKCLTPRKEGLPAHHLATYLPLPVWCR